MSKSLEALRRANPRLQAGPDASVDSVAVTVLERIASDANPLVSEPASSRRARSVSLAAAALAAVAAVVAVLAVGWPGGGNGVQDAAAAVKKAATLTGASAERSGVAVVRVTHDGQAWAGATIRWHEDDLSITQDAPSRHGRPGSAFLLVDGTMYGVEDGHWLVLGPPESIDPGSGTTPDEYLAAARGDVGGATLRRIVDGMTGLTTTRLPNGSIVYRGVVPARLIARGTGFKEGERLRMLPFGYVVHGEAANPSAPLDAAVTVRDGVIRELAVSWDDGWTYRVAYTGLGETPAPAAPADAQPLMRR